MKLSEIVMLRRSIKTKWLHIPVESRTRELDGKLFLACNALERGYSVVLGKKNAVTRSRNFLPRGMLFEQSLAPFRESEFETLFKKGFRLCAMDEEGIHFYRQPENAIKGRISKKNLKLFEYYFCWGTGQQKLIADSYPEFTNKIIASGTYRNDMYHQSLQNIWETKAKKLRKKYGPFLLFPSNFTNILNPRGGRDYVINQFIDQGITTDKNSADFMRRFLDHEETALNIFEKSFLRLAREFPNHKIILRAHPGELPNYWECFAQKHPNLIACVDGPILPWLLAMDALVHHGCSTGLESHYINKPAIAYHPVYSEEFDTHLSTRLGPIAYDEDQLIQLARQVINGVHLDQGDTSWLDRFIIFHKDNYAVDIILNHIDLVALPKEHFFHLKRIPSYIKFKLKIIWNKYLKRTIRKISRKDTGPTIASQKWGYLSESDISEYISKYQEVTGRFSNVKVTKLDGQVFMLTQKNG